MSRGLDVKIAHSFYLSPFLHKWFLFLLQLKHKQGFWLSLARAPTCPSTWANCARLLGWNANVQNDACFMCLNPSPPPPRKKDNFPTLALVEVRIIACNIHSKGFFFQLQFKSLAMTTSSGIGFIWIRNTLKNDTKQKITKANDSLVQCQIWTIFHAYVGSHHLEVHVRSIGRAFPCSMRHLHVTRQFVLVHSWKT